MNSNPPFIFSGTRTIAIKPAIIFGVLVLSLLTGCGTKGVIQTVDDSADYKSALSLPPLKKPALDQTLPSSRDEVSNTPEDVVLSKPVIKEPIAKIEVPVKTVSNPDRSVAPQSIAARVVNDDGDTSTLEIDAPFDQAWEYLVESLQKSDVTIFTRNKAAGRFSIGCADIVDDNVIVKKRGGWSIFTRTKSEELEYCALQVAERKNMVLVSVLNRSGAVVSTGRSNRVFERILNN